MLGLSAFTAPVYTSSAQSASADFFEGKAQAAPANYMLMNNDARFDDIKTQVIGAFANELGIEITNASQTSFIYRYCDINRFAIVQIIEGENILTARLDQVDLAKSTGRITGLTNSYFTQRPERSHPSPSLAKEIVNNPEFLPGKEAIILDQIDNSPRGW